MTTYLNIVQIILSIALIALIVLQAKGGSLQRMFGGEGAVFTKRRGAEKVLFNITVGLIVVFFVFSLLSVILQR